MTDNHLWSIQGGKPIQLNRNPISLEKELEDWIEQDSTLVNPDLLIVQRQMHVEAGVLDLLALDRLGNFWAVIEVKRGNVRRETISQAFDYAACIHEMTETELRTAVESYLKSKGLGLSRLLKENNLDKSVFDPSERNLVIYVVGTGRDPNLERMANFLRKSGIQVNVVTFDAFDDGAGNWTLLRQLEELEMEVRSKLPAKPSSPVEKNSGLEHLIEKAHKNGIGEAFEIIYQAATKHGLFPRLYSQSITYTPPSDKRRFLIYTPTVRKNGEYSFIYKPEAFAEFFPIGTARALYTLGVFGWQKMTTENAQKFARKLDKLFEIIDANSQG